MKRRLRKKVIAVLACMLVALLMGVILLFIPKEKKETIKVTPTPHGEAEALVVKNNPEEDERFFDVNSYLVCANKKHPLPEGYEPSDLTIPNVEMRYNTWQLRQEAAKAIEEMFSSANKDNIQLVCGSGYRSAAFQKILYDNYVNNYGKEEADTFSSRPGYSDHQTGLATDLCGMDESTDLDVSFENTEEGKWLKDHAHEYGFIMRYPKGKKEITGYMYEPWHFRYVGIEEATKIYEKGEFYSFEEYYGISGGEYAD